MFAELEHLHKSLDLIQRGGRERGSGERGRERERERENGKHFLLLVK